MNLEVSKRTGFHTVMKNIPYPTTKADVVFTRSHRSHWMKLSLSPLSAPHLFALYPLNGGVTTAGDAADAMVAATAAAAPSWPATEVARLPLPLPPPW